MQLILPSTCSFEAVREMALLMHYGLSTDSRERVNPPSTVSAYRGDRRVWPAGSTIVGEVVFVEPSVDDAATCLVLPRVPTVAK